MDVAAEIGRNSVSEHQIQPEHGECARPNSPVRTVTGNIHFPCSADHEQDWQPYPVKPYSAYVMTITRRVVFYITCCTVSLCNPVKSVVSFTARSYLGSLFN